MENNTAKTEDTWYYVIVQEPGSSTEQFVGFKDPETQDKFIPAFKTKDEAKACFALMPKDLFKGDYDAQAVIQEDLVNSAENDGHQVYLLDAKGTILDYIK